MVTGRVWTIWLQKPCTFHKIPNLNSVSVSSKINLSDQNPISLSDLHMPLRKKKPFEDMVQLRENVWSKEWNKQNPRKFGPT